MPAVHQLLPDATPYDAIMGQAFAWQKLLRSWGCASEIVAEHVHPDLLGRVHRLDRRARRLLESGGLVLRYALWSRTVDTALRAKGPVALCYHNITPGKLLREFNPAVADLCDRGRAMLPTFKGRMQAVIADSSFNAAELRDAGIGEATVVPLLLDLPDEVPRREPSRQPVVLTVGRIVPNKRLEDVIKGFTLYQRHRAPAASLVIVGSDAGFEGYRRALEVTRGAYRRHGTCSSPARSPLKLAMRGTTERMRTSRCRCTKASARRLSRPSAAGYRSSLAAPAQCPRRLAARASC